MLSFLQKSDQNQGPLIPAWHPNFRDHERLPDTKVVRTQFFVNFAAIAIAASLLLYFSYQEYRINNLGHQVADWQGQIDTNQKASEQAMLVSEKFAAEEKKIAELEAFVKQRVQVSLLLQHLGNTLPANLAFDVVDVRDAGIDLRGIAAGTPDEASGHTSAYVEQLKQDKTLSGIFEDVALNRLERDQANGRLSFDIYLRFKGAGAKK